MSRNVLLILGDSAEAKAVRRSLVNSPEGTFKVELVSRCSDAIKRLGSETGEQIAAIVVDLYLPDSQGIDTFDSLLRASPYVPILVLSHSRDVAIARLAVQRGAQDYLLQERLDGYSLSKALSNMLARSAYAEALFLEKERAQVTLNSIGDAVISTDVRPRHLSQSGRRGHDGLVVTGRIRSAAAEVLQLSTGHPPTRSATSGRRFCTTRPSAWARTVCLSGAVGMSLPSCTPPPPSTTSAGTDGGGDGFPRCQCSPRDVAQDVLYSPTRLSHRVAQSHVAERPTDAGDSVGTPPS